MVGKWKFDGTIVPIFDDHVRKSVPMYDEMNELITSLAAFFLEDGTNVYDIGTSTGEVIYNLTREFSGRPLHYIGVDTSPEMVVKSTERFKKLSNIDIVNADVMGSGFIIENASLIVSSLTAQFIPQRNRRELFEKVYQGINEGCAFILFEKIIGSSARLDVMYRDLYYDLKLKNGLSPEDIINKSQAIRGVLRPNSIEETTSSLYDVGFKDVDIFFRWNNFAGFLAVK